MSTPLRELYDRAADLPADERASFLAALESEGHPLAARLREMFRNDPPPSPLDAGPWADTGSAAEPEADDRPSRLGPYRILSELGRGGMGRVYLAEQEGLAFRRRVALKVVATTGPSAAEIERRFRSEQAILAELEHPGIARFYDAGRDASGVWYIALEHVPGADLVTHAREHALSLAERLQLFLAVLEAVAWAHQRSVVHRDLKPSNILVGADGRPRLLDFGIARLLATGSGGAADATLTRAGSRALTPAYASPEQFRGDEIGPASDVFSLGLILYELLTDSRPFARATSSDVELERAVLTDDPPPPSATRRRTATAPEGVPAGEATVHATPARIPRDLDAICMKALRKEAAERYPTATEFAIDFERLLAGLPVAARFGGRGYRFGRFARRHRAAAGVAGALLLALAAGYQARRSFAGRAPVEAPAPRPFPYSGAPADEIETLELQFATEPANLDTGARLALALDRSGRQPEARLLIPRLRQIPGRSDDPLVDYVEASLATSADEPQRALVLYGTALERAIAAGRGELVAQVRASRGHLFSTLGRSAEASTDMTFALAEFEAAGDERSAARVLNDLAVEALQRGRPDEGHELLERALAATRRANGPASGGVMLLNLAGVDVLLGRPDLADKRFAEAVALFRDSKSRRLSWALTDRSRALVDLGRTAEARGALDEAIQILAAGSSERDLAIALDMRGRIELDAAELAAAEATAAELEAAANASGDRPALAYADQLRGRLAAFRDDLPEARRRFAQARRLLAASGQADSAIDADLDRAAIEFRAGRMAEAAELAEQVRAARGATLPVTTPAFVAEALLAEIDAIAGRSDATRRRLDALGDSGDSPSLGRRVAWLSASARLAAREGRPEEAQRHLETALASATAAGHVVAELELRLAQLELLESEGGEVGPSGGAAPAPTPVRRAAIAEEAERLGLASLAARARRDAPTARDAGRR